MQGERLIRIAYIDGDGIESDRRVICRDVYSAEGRVYLDAVCLARGEVRNFRLDRIRRVSDEAGRSLGEPGSAFAVAGERPFAPGRNAGREAAVGVAALVMWAMQRPDLSKAWLDAAVRVVLRGATAEQVAQIGIDVGRGAGGLGELAGAAVKVARCGSDALLAAVELCVAAARAGGGADMQAMKTLERAVNIAGLPVEIYETAPPTTA